MPEITLIDHHTVGGIIDDLAEDWPALVDLGDRGATSFGRGPVLLDLGDGTFGVIVADDDNYWEDQAFYGWVAAEIPQTADSWTAPARDYPITDVTGHGALFIQLMPAMAVAR